MSFDAQACYLSLLLTLLLACHFFFILLFLHNIACTGIALLCSAVNDALSVLTTVCQEACFSNESLHEVLAEPYVKMANVL